jgi:peptide deformylase
MEQVTSMDTEKSNQANPILANLNARALAGLEELEIVHFPDPILKKVADPVTEFDEDLEKFCFDMLNTMYRAPGIGLAAPQVSVSKQIIVMDIDFEKESRTKPNGTEEKYLTNQNPRILINPKIVEKDGTQLYEEGCLSLPGIFEKVKRAETIKLEYQDVKGENQVLEAEGTLSVCIQHEMDHLKGIVFIDHLSSFKKSFYRKKMIKEKKRYS